MVVFETISPSTPRRQRRRDDGVERRRGTMSGAIFSRIAVRAVPDRRASRASMQRARRSSRNASPCRSRRPGVFGDETLTVRKSTRPHKRARRRSRSRRCGRSESLLAPMFTPTMPGRPRRRRRRASHRLKPVAVQAEAVDDRLVPRQPEDARARDCPAAASARRRRFRRSRNRAPSSWSGTSHCLSKPAARPTGFGKCRPKSIHREARVVLRRRGVTGISERPGSSARAPSPRRARGGPLAGRSAKQGADHASKVRKDVTAVADRAAAASSSARPRAAGAHRDAGTGRRRARARSAELRPSASASTATRRRSVLTGKMPRGRLRTCPRGKVDVAVLRVDQGAGEATGALPPRATGLRARFCR